MEESYVQDVEQINRFGYRMNTRGGVSHRQLKSDLLLVRPEGSDAWMQFRDVFEVDGKTLRDRNDRLAKLFLQPSKSTTSQAEKIVRESARYNIGDIERTINLPFLAMTVLDRRMQPSFQFRITEPNEDLKLPKSAAFADRPGRGDRGIQRNAGADADHHPAGEEPAIAWTFLVRHARC